MITAKKAKLKADQAFSKYIRARDGTCMLAGLDKIKCSSVLQCMHLMTRGVYILRFDEANALAGCSGHHIWYTSHPNDWITLLQKHFKKNWDYIVSMKNEEAHYKVSDYLELARFYDNKLKRL